MNFNYWLCLEDLSDDKTGENVFIKGKIYKELDKEKDLLLQYIIGENNIEYYIKERDFLFQKLNKEDSICKASLDKYGSREQIGMLMEECMELAFACRKHLRNPSSERQNNIIEEIADVEIMIKQFKMISSEFHKAIKNQRKFKINRLKKRLCKQDQKE